MKQLLVLTSTYPRWNNDNEPRFVHDLSKQFTSQYEVTVIAPHTFGAAPTEYIDSVKIERFKYFFEKWQSLAYQGGIMPKLREKPVRALLIPFFIIGMVFKVTNYLKHNQVDAIHAHWILPQGLIAIIALKLAGKKIPLIVTSHGTDLFALKGSMFVLLKQFVIRQATVVTVVSQAMREYCRSKLKVRRNIVVRSMGIDTRTTFIDKTNFIDRKGLVYIGRLVEKKGVDLLIRAFAITAEKYPTLKLNIVGDGNEKEALKQLSHELGITNKVLFLGGTDSLGVVRSLNMSKICVMPSRQEGLGLIAGEALACGCICIVSDLDAIKDIHNCPELTFERDNIEKLVECLTFAIEQESEALRLCNTMKKNVISEFDWSKVGDDYIKIFQEIT